jgi:hypothetical protein
LEDLLVLPELIAALPAAEREAAGIYRWWARRA